MIAQNETNVQREFVIKLVIAQSHIGILKGGFQYKLSNGAGAIIPYPTFEEKHI